MSDITADTDLRPIEECAKFAGLETKALRNIIRTRRGTPTMVTLLRGVDLVVWPEFLAWLNARRSAGPECDRLVAQCRPSRSEAARRRLVRVEDQA